MRETAADELQKSEIHSPDNFINSSTICQASPPLTQPDRSRDKLIVRSRKMMNLRYFSME